MEKDRMPNQNNHVQQEENIEAVFTLDYYQSLNYDIRLRRKGKHFVLAIMELGIVEKSEDLTMAYEKIQAAKEAYFRSMIEDDFADSIVKPADFNTTIKPTSLANRPNLENFLIKTGIVAIVITLFVFFIVNPAVKYNYNKLKSIEREFKGIADWSDERVEKYKLRARNIARKIKPIAEEVKIVWESASPDDSAKK